MSDWATWKYQPKEHEELLKIADGIFSERVFTSDHVRNNDVELLSRIFMPIIFAGEGFTETLKRENISMFYEEFKNAGPRAINGYPIFWGMGMLNEVDAVVVRKMVGDLFEAKKKILEEAREKHNRSVKSNE